MNFYDLMRASHVKRWHIVNTSKEQNLAEHQWNVTTIGLRLYELTEGREPPAGFIAALMFHDVAEIRYGDVPTPGKAFMREVLGDCAGDFFQHMDKLVCPTTPFVNNVPDSAWSVMIRLADMIEAAWWIRENGCGHHAQVVASKLWDSLEDYVHKTGLYTEINSILISLGMPYVNKAMKDSPP